MPASLNGIAAFAPELAKSGGSFKPEFFVKLADQEARSFWFNYRNRLIVWALQKYCPRFESLFELGCGTGYVLSAISAKWPERMLGGSDIFVEGLEFASQRLKQAELLQMDGRAIPYVDHFDVMCAFDVLEHIEEDEAVLGQLHAALKRTGTLLLTVPQHAWLWSPVDDHACHVRRYDARDLHAKIERAGFRVTLSTSFVSLLLPAMLASRVLSRRKTAETIATEDELDLSPWLNAMFGAVCRLEFALIRAGMRFPLGGSRLIVATKTSEAS